MNRETLRAVVAGGAGVPMAAVADQLAALGYDVVARVDAGREAVDAVRRLAPDAVVLDTHLADGLGVLVAQVVTRAAPGLAALVLSGHPAVADRGARPRWGAVSLLPSGADASELDVEIRDAVTRARALAAVAPDVPAPSTAFGTPSVDARRAGDRAVSRPVVAEDACPVAAAADAIAADAIAADAIAAGDADAGGAHHVVADLVAVGAEHDAALALDGHRSVVEQAIDAVAERTGMSAADVLHLMEQEADDSGQTLLEVAQSMLREESAVA